MLQTGHSLRKRLVNRGDIVTERVDIIYKLQEFFGGPIKFIDCREAK